MAEAILLDRDNMKELLAYLTNEAAGEDVREKLALVISRKLDLTKVPLATGTTSVDRLERFFDTILTIAEPLPIPFSQDELVARAENAVCLLVEQANDALDDENDSPEDREDMYRCYTSDAADYQKIVDLFRAGKLREGFDAHGYLDTAARHWIFVDAKPDTDGKLYYANEMRFWATEEAL